MNGDSDTLKGMKTKCAASLMGTTNRKRHGLQGKRHKGVGILKIKPCSGRPSVHTV